MIPPHTIAQRAREASLALLAIPAAARSRTLLRAAHNLVRRKNAIIDMSKKDVARARALVSQAFLDRLTLNDRRFHEMARAVREIAGQKDVLGQMMEKRRIENGVVLRKVRVPLGVLLVIYEARPHVTADAAALALRAGNAIILKGGSEAMGANRLIAQCFTRALKDTGLPAHAVQFIDTPDRSVLKKLLQSPEMIDLVIPRGGYGLVRWVQKESQIPYLSHAAGLDHFYVDPSAALVPALKVIMNAKINFPAGCNALDHLLVHTRIARRLLPRLQEVCTLAGVELRGDIAVRKIIKTRAATQKDWDTEYLSLKMGVKIVRSIEEAIAHINAHGSKHSEGILARDKHMIEKFKAGVDAAAIFVNCSLRLHDGGVFGLGAEMGINTGKLHARGPVGAEELTTYKWIAEGRGQVRE